MREILAGLHPIAQDAYTVEEIADRYDVDQCTAYKGIRRSDGMYPTPEARAGGVRPRVVIRGEAVEACDRNRVAFYRTTPSWNQRFVNGAPAAPLRRSARVVIADLR